MEMETEIENLQVSQHLPHIVCDINASERIEPPQYSQD